MIALHELWAKTNPIQSIVTHGMVSGVVAQELLKQFLTEGNRKQLSCYLKINQGELQKFIGYFVSLHDIGKIHYYFQSGDPRMQARLKGEGLGEMSIPDFHFRHEKESCQAMRRIWEPYDRRTGRILAEILGAHHQGKIASKMHPTAAGRWIEMQCEYEKRMREIFLDGELKLPIVKRENESILAAILLGMVILADWIASCSYFLDAENWEDKLEKSRVRVIEFLQKSGLNRTKVDFGHSFCDV